MSRRTTKLEEAITAITKEIDAAVFELAVLQGTRERLRALRRREPDEARELELEADDAAPVVAAIGPNGRERQG
jgi:hypothetical protein